MSPLTIKKAYVVINMSQTGKTKGISPPVLAVRGFEQGRDLNELVIHLVCFTTEQTSLNERTNLDS